jgi:hypothetical protein
MKGETKGIRWCNSGRRVKDEATSFGVRGESRKASLVKEREI